MLTIIRCAALLFAGQLGYHLIPHYLEHPFNVFSYIFTAAILAVLCLLVSIDVNANEGLRRFLTALSVAANLITLSIAAGT